MITRLVGLWLLKQINFDFAS